MEPLELRISASEHQQWRELCAALKGYLQQMPSTAPLAIDLSCVAWELLTNLRTPEALAGIVDLCATSQAVILRLPGPRFDSVARSLQSGARGLDTAAWRLRNSGWKWSYRYVDQANEITLEPQQP